MLPLLTAEQIRQVDAHTIANEPISSVDLMERAGKAFVGWFINHYPDKEQRISIYCGAGNNGGDGLVIARLLDQHQYRYIRVTIARFGKTTTADFDINFERLRAAKIPFQHILPGEDFPPEDGALIIDALLGSGLNKPLSGDYARLVSYINGLTAKVVAVDVPTGMYTEGDIDEDAVVMRTDLTITFQQPKINFLLPESGPFINCWEAVNIGLDESFITTLESPYQFVEEKDIRAMLKHRPRFSNKGTFGHALIVAGQPETMGAALLSASACAHAGAGLTTACIPQSGLTALNSYQPEVMAIVRNGSQARIEWDKFTSVAIGPGLGIEEDSKSLLKNLFDHYKHPAVIDADALNILSETQALLKTVPAGSIITPHMKEFDRLFGYHKSWWQRIQTAISKAAELQLFIVLKNSYTIIITPGGKVYFNSTSNSAMASGGMGDVLTGILVALLAQKYTPEQACILGVYIHGKAGDELALPNRVSVVLPGKLIGQLPVTMGRLSA